NASAGKWGAKRGPPSVGRSLISLVPGLVQVTVFDEHAVPANLFDTLVQSIGIETDLAARSGFAGTVGKDRVRHGFIRLDIRLFRVLVAIRLSDPNCKPTADAFGTGKGRIPLLHRHRLLDLPAILAVEPRQLVAACRKVFDA